MIRIRWRHLLLSSIAGWACHAGAGVAQDGVGKGYSQVPTGAYSIIAEVKAKPGKETELRAVTLPLIAQVRSDPKNLVYFLQEARDAPGRFVFYEIFATRPDFEATTRCLTSRIGWPSFPHSPMAGSTS